MSEMLGSWAALAARGCEVARVSDVDAPLVYRNFTLDSHGLDGSHEESLHVDQTQAWLRHCCSSSTSI